MKIDKYHTPKAVNSMESSSIQSSNLLKIAKISVKVFSIHIATNQKSGHLPIKTLKVLKILYEFALLFPEFPLLFNNCTSDL